MTFLFRPRIRHPFFPGFNPTPAVEAKGNAPALCGAFSELEQAAARGVSAKRAVFVVIEWNGAAFTATERDRLWDLFQTPVYAIQTGREGRVEAFECEVQNGFHLPGKPAADAEAVCECGRAGPILGSNLRRAPASERRVAAVRAEAV